MHSSPCGRSELRDVNWIPDGERRTPLDAAIRCGATDLAAWLPERGASTAAELDR
jgi:hypothetical protein